MKYTIGKNGMAVTICDVSTCIELCFTKGYEVSLKPG